MRSQYFLMAPIPSVPGRSVLPWFRSKSRNALQELITNGKPKYPKFLSNDALSLLKVSARAAQRMRDTLKDEGHYGPEASIAVVLCS